VTVETVVDVYPILQPTRMSGERCKSCSKRLPQRGLGLSPNRNDVWAFYTQFLCDFRRVLVHFGGWLSGKITPKIQENIGLTVGVGKVTCMRAFR